MKDLVIVGGGQSAAQCVLTLRRNDFKAPITIISEEHHLPYQRPPLSKEYLADEVSLDRVYMKSQDFFDQNNVAIKHSMKAISLDRESKTVNLSSGDNIEYKNLVIATGSRVRELDVEGSHLKNINYLRTIDDSNDLKKYFKSGKKLVIIGAGYIGLEVAAIAAKKNKKVTVIEMADRVMNRTVDPQISDYYLELHKKNGVSFKFNTSLKEVIGTKHPEKVLCSDGSEIKADMVIIGAGILPNTELAESAGVSCDNGIIVDEFGKTSHENIFACGDCTNHPNKLLNKKIRLESVHNAMEQSKTVASGLLNEPIEYNQIPWFWSDQYDHKLQIVGLSGEHDKVTVRGNISESKFMLFYTKREELIAVDAVNNSKEFLISRKLVANKVKINAEQISNPDTNLNDLIE